MPDTMIKFVMFFRMGGKGDVELGEIPDKHITFKDLGHKISVRISDYVVPGGDRQFGKLHIGLKMKHHKTMIKPRQEVVFGSKVPESRKNPREIYQFPEDWNPREAGTQYIRTIKRHDGNRDEISHVFDAYDVLSLYGNTKGETPGLKDGFLMTFAVNDYQPRDNEKSILKKEKKYPGDYFIPVNPFPKIYTSVRSRYADGVIVPNPDSYMKSHLLIEIPYKKRWKTIDRIVIKDLSCGTGIVLDHVIDRRLHSLQGHYLENRISKNRTDD